VQLTTELTIDAPPEVVWPVLADVERVAPCLPGATLTSSEGDAHAGNVVVKVGPIRASYEGLATVVERSDDDRRLVVDARGRDKRNGSTAAATVTATARPQGAATVVDVDIDLAITGRIAQFGRGALADVTNRLAREFGTNLESTLAAATAGGDDTPGTPAAGTPAPGAAPLDLGRLALPALRPVLAALGALVTGAVVFAVVRRRRQ
jgi:carbon monoxide dehydrogenase subunit G